MKKIISFGMVLIILCQLSLPCFATTLDTTQDLEYVIYSVNTKTESLLSVSNDISNTTSPSYIGDTDKINQAYSEFEQHFSTVNNGYSTYTILGDDDREKIGYAPFIPYCRICLLIVTWPNGHISKVTGWLYDSDRVATAGHCVYNSKYGGWASQIVVQPGRYDDIAPFGQANSIQMLSVKGWTEDADHKYDFGLIALDEPIGDICGYFGYSIEQFPLGKEVTIIGYPDDKIIDNNICQWGMSGNIVLYSTRKLAYYIDTYGGQSGSPIFLNDNTVIGVHTNSGTSSNTGRRIDSTMFSLMQTF